MWSNSNGDEIKLILNKLNKMNLSDDAKEILEIVLLTNTYFPKINITEEEFINYKTNFLIKNSDHSLSEERDKRIYIQSIDNIVKKTK